MIEWCRNVLGLLLCLLLMSAALCQHCLAEVNVSVKVKGVQGEQLDNVRAYLTLQQRKSDKSLTERWLQLLHDDAPAEIRG